MATGDGSRLTTRDGRKFAWTLAAACAVLAAIERWRARPMVALVLAIVAAIAFLAGALVPTRLGAVQRAWTRLGESLSTVTRPVVLRVLYWVVLTPAGVMRRSFGRSPLARSRDATSFWVRREPRSADEARRAMERMF